MRGNLEMLVNKDCRYFRGDIPCIFNKREGIHCDNCKYYSKTKEKILIIKLGAIGDVIRTTPLLVKLKNEYPESMIYWLTLTPEILPNSIDKKLNFELKNILFVENTTFDILINLDKDLEACALAKKISTKKKFGFTLANGVPVPINDFAKHKYLTGLFDDISQINKKSYVEEIFEICGYKFSGEKYLINRDNLNYHWDLPKDKKIVGLNTGCGIRWKSRLWPEEYWIEIARKLKKSGYEVLLLGGQDEHEKNIRIQKATDTIYFGHFPLKQFTSLIDQCDLVITTVTMTLHIAIALEKKIVLFNNVFNKYEFELYGLGKILEPPNCTCYYVTECDKNCMKDLKVSDVFNTTLELLESVD